MRYTLSVPAFVLMLVAGWFMFAGFSVETTLPSNDPTIGALGVQGISNLQLMHIQLLDFVTGLVAGLASAVLFAGAAIVAAVQDRANEQP